MTVQQVVSPSQIERTLNSIWEALESTNKMRASLFNLIIYAPKNERASYIHKVAEKMIERFPSRVILISVDKTPGQNYLNTKVSVMASAEKANDVACDFIEIDVAGEHQIRIPFLILPHLLPDLPVYIVWAEDPWEDAALLSELEKIATRVIFDSELADHLPRFAKIVLSHKERGHVDIADLNWARLENFRDALSSTFYHPDKQKALKEIKSVQITYNSSPTPFCCHMNIQALYLQGWLASQLDWKFTSVKDEAQSQTLTYAEGVSATLIPVSYPNFAPGIIMSVEIWTRSEEHFVFQRNFDLPHQISMTHSNKDLCDLPLYFIFTKAGSGQSLVREMCHKGTSSHYLKLLESIVKIGEASPLC
jgi:glucose-6-phosphate dehydrogenase assembly protein OpcA